MRFTAGHKKPVSRQTEYLSLRYDPASSIRRPAFQRILHQASRLTPRLVEEYTTRTVVLSSIISTFVFRSRSLTGGNNLLNSSSTLSVKSYWFILACLEATYLVPVSTLPTSELSYRQCSEPRDLRKMLTL